MSLHDPDRTPDGPFLLYGAERSYFTAKVRPALRAKQVYFEELLPTPAAYQDMVQRTGLAFLPTVVTPEDITWQDTSEILDALEQRIPEPALYPTTPVQRIVAYLIELYADEFMLLPAMHYRWSEPKSEQDARGAFAALSGNREAANAFASRMKGSLPLLGVSEHSAPAIEAHLAELIDAMEALFAEQSFFLGSQPSLADCAMMGPFYAHLYLDIRPGQLVRDRAPLVSHWIESANHPNISAFDGFLPGDSLANSLSPILHLIGQDAVPLVLGTIRAFEEWADSRPEELEEPPRAVGRHNSALRGVELTRYTSAYTLWMTQRCLDAYGALSPAERKAVGQCLAGTGCEALLDYRPRHRLEKQNFKLVFARP